MSSVRIVGVLLLGASLILFGPGRGRGESQGVNDPEVVTGQEYAKVIQGLRGKAVMVNFWATWCEPCRDEYPVINDLAREYKGRIVVLGVSWDEDAEMGIVRRFLAKYQPVFVNYRKKPGNEIEFVKSIHPQWSGTLPTTFFYAQDGKVTGYLVGGQKRAQLEAKIRELLEKPAAEGSSKEPSTLVLNKP